MFLTGLGVFTASSLASAMAGTAGELFAARAGQGLGAAMLSPAALSIITTAFHGNQRAKALAAWGAVGGAGAAIGVLVGGLLTELADWRMIFYVNLPVAVALAVTALKVIPGDAEKPALARPRPARRDARYRQPGRDRLRDHAGRVQAGLRPRRSAHGPRRPRRSRRVRGARAPHRSRFCASSGSPTAPSAAASS